MFWDKVSQFSLPDLRLWLCGRVFVCRLVIDFVCLFVSVFLDVFRFILFLSSSFLSFFLSFFLSLSFFLVFCTSIDCYCFAHSVDLCE